MVSFVCVVHVVAFVLFFALCICCVWLFSRHFHFQFFNTSILFHPFVNVIVIMVFVWTFDWCLHFLFQFVCYSSVRRILVLHLHLSVYACACVCMVCTLHFMKRVCYYMTCTQCAISLFFSSLVRASFFLKSSIIIAVTRTALTKQIIF